MSEEGQRIEFDDNGPYLIQNLDVPPQGMLLEEHAVCLLQFENLYFPVALDVCAGLADALSNMSQTAVGPEKEGMTPLAFDAGTATEMPLITGCADESFQCGDVIYLDVLFGETQARLCLSIMAAATVGQIVSQIPAE